MLRLDIKWFIAAVCFAGAVFTLSHIPQGVIPRRLLVWGIDKVEHFVAYAIMTLLFLCSLRRSAFVLSAFLVLAAILALGVVDEVTQRFVNRVSDTQDWLANAAGALVMVILVAVRRLWMRLQKRGRWVAE